MLLLFISAGKQLCALQGFAHLLLSRNCVMPLLGLPQAKLVSSPYKELITIQAAISVITRAMSAADNRVLLGLGSAPSSNASRTKPQLGAFMPN